MNKQLRMNEGIYRLLSEPAGVLAFKRSPEATEKRTDTDGKKTTISTVASVSTEASVSAALSTRWWRF